MSSSFRPRWSRVFSEGPKYEHAKNAIKDSGINGMSISNPPENTNRDSGINGMSISNPPEKHMPPPDRPITDAGEKILPTLTKGQRREWWRLVAEEFNRTESWAEAETWATDLFIDDARIAREERLGMKGIYS